MHEVVEFIGWHSSWGVRVHRGVRQHGIESELINVSAIDFRVAVIKFPGAVIRFSGAVVKFRGASNKIHRI